MNYVSASGEVRRSGFSGGAPNKSSDSGVVTRAGGHPRSGQQVTSPAELERRLEYMAEVERLSVGRLSSLVKLQGCRNYSQIDLSNLPSDLRELRSSGRQPTVELKDELDNFWTELGSTLSRKRSRSRSRQRSGNLKTHSRPAQPVRRTGAEEAPKEVDDINPMRTAVENFIRANGLDERAADCLRKCNPPIQQYAMGVGNLHAYRNPSSALVHRIKELKLSQHMNQQAMPQHHANFHGVFRPMAPMTVTSPHPSAIGNGSQNGPGFAGKSNAESMRYLESTFQEFSKDRGPG